MSETHPNAFRAEADAKRVQAVQLNAEADALEAKAEALEPSPPKPAASKRDAKGHFTKGAK